MGTMLGFTAHLKPLSHQQLVCFSAAKLCTYTHTHAHMKVFVRDPAHVQKNLLSQKGRCGASDSSFFLFFFQLSF